MNPPLRPNRTQNVSHQQLQAAQYGAVCPTLDDFRIAAKYFECWTLLRLGAYQHLNRFNHEWREWIDQLVHDIRLGILMLASPAAHGESLHGIQPISLCEIGGLDQKIQAD